MAKRPYVGFCVSFYEIFELAHVQSAAGIAVGGFKVANNGQLLFSMVVGECGAAYKQ
jgi:hypothetical protein